MVGKAAEGTTVHTIYFGGGTPTLLKVHHFQKILATIRQLFSVKSGAEVSVEANPNTLTSDYLQGIKGVGINRISLGMQSAQDNELRFLERQHSADQVAKAVSWARQAGFDNLSLDLIFGIPGQTLESWKKNLEFAMAMQPDHLSLYALGIEIGTPLYSWAQRGLVETPDPDLAADMYEWAGERLIQANYLQYEISNWARIKKNGEIHLCKHNMQYWRLKPYLGFGAGAHGYADGWRTANLRQPLEYIQRMMGIEQKLHPAMAGWRFGNSPAFEELSQPDKEIQMGEVMMMGLRLIQEGVLDADFKDRFGVSLMGQYRHDIDMLVGSGLLEWYGSPAIGVRLTKAGRLLGNQVFIRFI